MSVSVSEKDNVSEKLSMKVSVTTAYLSTPVSDWWCILINASPTL